MLNLTQLTKTYPGGTTALSSVTLRVPRGEFCVLLGASGAGKSTLLRAVNGLAAIDGGQVEVDGTAVTRRTISAVRRRVGMIHQQFNLVPRLSVLDNVLAGALPVVSMWRVAARWFPRDLRRKACRLLAEVGLSETHLNRRASSLSGGQQQRVAIARAMMLDPVVILADEPVASLDPQTSAGVMELLRQTAKAKNVTVLCSLHQLDLAIRFADRVVAMKQGRVVFDGSTIGLDAGQLHDVYAASEDRGDETASRRFESTATGTHQPESFSAAEVAVA